MASRCKILIASHSPTCTTGYGRVTRRLAHAFGKAGHTVGVVGMSYRGGPHELPYRIFPWQDRRPGESFTAACREFAPDVLLTIGDPWMFEFLPSLPERRSAAWIAYFPVDGRPLPEEWKPWIAAVDVPVVFCRFTQDLVAAATGKPPELIYHGVDTKRFRPMDKPTAKKLANVADHFVVGTVARNQQRKNLPALLRAFAKFSRDKEDVLLYLHTQVRAEWDLKELTRSLGIESKTRVTADLGGGSGIPDEMLATVYNALDLFVLPTMAEGFGLPIMELQACGVPALATDFSACSELVPEPIQRLKVKDTLVMHRNFEQAIVDVDDIAEKMEHFYRERAELEALGRRCHDFARQFEWEIACRQFVELVGKVPARASTAVACGAGQCEPPRLPTRCGPRP
jgi:glycosyltransferase involved in cell wall biosynthesis